MKKGMIYIGTSGWNYKHWINEFYPDDLPQKKWLQFYIDKGFRTVELNNSFYHLPKKTTFDNWKKSVPKDFIFSIKASRYITHIKKLKAPKTSSKKLFERIDRLKKKAGPILFQLPPGWKYNKKRLKDFIEKISDKYNYKYKYTFEFRNKTWWNDEVFDLLKKHKIAFCIYELEGTITPKEVTADFSYVRLHGPGGKYQGDYNESTLKSWADFFKKESGKGKNIYCYFDNDEKGYAAKNALELKELI